MRIIAGVAKGRRLAALQESGKKSFIRPTSDRAREALFNILGSFVDKAHVLDLFAGTGALGLEALSRGAAHAVFVDSNGKALQLIKKNLTLCGFGDRAEVIKCDLGKIACFTKRLAEQPCFDLVFIDPPYNRQLTGDVVKQLGSAEILNPEAIVVVEEYHKVTMPEVEGCLVMFEKRRYGDTAFRFYKAEIS